MFDGERRPADESRASLKLAVELSLDNDTP